MPTHNARPAWDRFWEKVDFGDCWEWTRAKDRDGYGRFQYATRLTKKAHRVAWEFLVGPIPDGFEIDHRCRNRACVNPDHLEVVPGRVNVLRSGNPLAVNARKTKCKRGHAFTPENTYTKTHGGRMCRKCDRARQRAAYQARKAA